ncbi:YopX family protein [Elizabethkingia anophelis]|uniref:YopX family protein n=1 Tax=Elizabethkingia anophelis TaxID=1117645 RepID=UPI003891DB0C
MREIIFRGKRIDNGEFIYGYLWCAPTECNIYKEDSEWSVMQDSFAVDSNTVGQFTGLVDRNGNRIFEGDIILFQKFANWDDDKMKRHKAKVIFKEGCFMWEILEYGYKSDYYAAYKTEPLRNTNDTWGLEVIGSIHESLTPNK